MGGPSIIPRRPLGEAHSLARGRATSKSHTACCPPHPNPPPTRGEGLRRVSRVHISPSPAAGRGGRGVRVEMPETLTWPYARGRLSTQEIDFAEGFNAPAARERGYGT